VRHILAKFSVQSRTQAVLAAMRLGLISSQSTAHKETTDHA
jgi:ATP/maltotriose-dependent transcriptional regulator MalT